MASFNSVVLLGNVTRDVEVRYLQGGSAVCDIGLAVNEKYKKGDEWVEDVTFVDITLWGRTAEVAGEYLRKGSPVLISGRLKLDTWEKEGQKHSKLKVVGERMQLIGGKRGEHDQSRDESPSEYSQEPAKPTRTAKPCPVVDESEIPF